MREAQEVCIARRSVTWRRTQQRRTKKSKKYTPSTRIRMQCKQTEGGKEKKERKKLNWIITARRAVEEEEDSYDGCNRSTV